MGEAKAKVYMLFMKYLQDIFLKLRSLCNVSSYPGKVKPRQSDGGFSYLQLFLFVSHKNSNNLVSLR